MNNNPFDAWNIDENQFHKLTKPKDKLLFVAKYGILAPSSHNAQPWTFNITDNEIIIYPNLSRSLTYGDRTQREMHISIGCCIENIKIASQYFNMNLHLDLLPEKYIENVVGVFSISPHADLPVSNLQDKFKAITHRVTNRLGYTDKKLYQNIINTIKEHSNNDIEVTVVTEPNKIDEISKIMKQASQDAFNDNVFKKELGQWVRSNNTTKFDGMPLYGWGVPTPISLFASYIISNAPASIQSVLDQKSVLNSPALMIVSGKSDMKETWLHAGSTFESIALYLQSNGISASPMAGIIELEKRKNQLKEVLQIDTVPLFFCRLGYPKKNMQHSPRYNINQILK